MKFRLMLIALFAPFILAAQFTISGVIYDDNGLPLPAANIRLKGTFVGTYSDADGKYRMRNIPAGDYTLIVSYLGFDAYEKKVVLKSDVTEDFKLTEAAILGEEVIVSATRVIDRTPATVTNIEMEEIEPNNLGQDLPILIQNSPSVVSTSDAGAGVGYTGIRIRGTDASRINVTINGIPLNDAESQGVFWVNMPDFASSLQNIQIQRGVGSSTNGAAAFGATVNLQTNNMSPEAYGQVNNSFGSFNTRKHSVEVGSGMLNEKFAFEGRLSTIHSDGYIDRASSDLNSYYLAGGYYGEKTIIKAITFAGQEETYQSWYGTPESRVDGDVAAMNAFADRNFLTDEQRSNLLYSGRSYNFYTYGNQVDHYNQDHYQLHFTHQFSDHWTANAALHYTLGRGYFEEFREDDDLSDYNLEDIVIGNNTISSTDLVRRRWLDNDFYGLTYSVNYESRNKLSAILGGGANYYDGDHFGQVIWAQYASNGQLRHRYYDNTGKKSDANVFLKVNYALSDRMNLFGDIQYRNIGYEVEGVDNDQRQLSVDEQFNFINPKAGVNYIMDLNNSVYAFVGIGNREPNRNDFIDAREGETPESEQMINVELGYKHSKTNYFAHFNYYLMSYDNQLVPTGAVNDVGTAIRQNVENSYRTGIEFQGGVNINKQLTAKANITYSQNKIESFTDEVVNEEISDSDIAFSPEIIAGTEIDFEPKKDLHFVLYSRYVGDQYLDNTSNENRKLDAYLVNDLRLSYTLKEKLFKEVTFSLLVNNVFDAEYSSNGYTFSYLAGDLVTENFFYPQAGINFLAGINIRF